MKKNLHYVDALRGIAVLGVVMVHTSRGSLSGISSTLTGLGAKGVQLFYFISAFTLFLSASRRSHEETNPIRNFFIRRLFRIAPLYYCAIVYYAIIMPWLLGKKIALIGILCNFLFLHGFSPYYINSIVPGGWSIAVEMLFYLFVPALAIKINSFNKATIFLLLTLVIRMIFNFFLLKNPFHMALDLWKNYLYWYLPNQITNFSFGILFYFFMQQINISSFLAQHRKIIVYNLSGFILLFLISKFILRVEIINVDFLFCIAFFLLAFFLEKKAPVILVNKFTELLGRLSFSIYLVHFLVIYWLEFFSIIKSGSTHGLFKFIFDYLTVLFATTLIAYLTHFFIEQKGQNIGGLLIKRLNYKAIK